MKGYFVFLAIILVLKAASTSSMSIRDTSEGIKFYSTMTSLINDLKPMIEGVLQDIPSTEQFAKYKMKWNGFLRKYEGRVVGEECAIKILDILEEFADYADDWRQGKHVSMESQAIHTLFLRHGYVELSEKFLPLLENLVIPDDVLDVQAEC